MSKNSDLSRIVSTNANVTLQLNSLVIANSTANTWVFSSNGTMLVGGTPVINSTGLVGGGGFTNGSSIAVTNLDVTNSGVITVGNSTVNATANGTHYRINGNSSVYSTVNSSAVLLQGPGFYNLVLLSSSSLTMFANDASLASSVNGISISVSDSLNSKSATINSTALYISTNATGSAALISVGNSSVNSSLNATALGFNGSIGTNGQVLTSNGTVSYWANAAGGGFTNGSSIAVTNLDVTNSGVITVGNSFTVNTTSLSIGNSTINATVNATAMYVSTNSSVYSYLDTSTLYFRGLGNVVASTGNLHIQACNGIRITSMLNNNVHIETDGATTLVVGNSTVNSSLNATALGFNGGFGSGIEIITTSGNAYLYYNILNLASNTANVWVGSESQRVVISPSSISIGNMSSNAVVINTTAIGITSSAALLSLGNTSVNTSANATYLALTNANGDYTAITNRALVVNRYSQDIAYPLIEVYNNTSTIFKVDPILYGGGLITIGSSVTVSANSSNGTTGQVLTSNGTGVYWAGVSLLGNTYSAPANSSAEGIEGEIRFDSSYIYICTSSNTWKRVAISTW